MDPARLAAEDRPSFLGRDPESQDLRATTSGCRRSGVVTRSGRRVLARGHQPVSAEDSRPSARVWTAAILIVLSLAGSAVVHGDGPLTSADVARFLKAGISEST